MKKNLIGILNTTLTIDVDKISIERKHWTSFILNRENPTFLISDIKSLEWKPKQTFTEKPNIYFNVIGTDRQKDMFNNRSNDPYCFYFEEKQVDEMTEIYNYIMDVKSKKTSNSEKMDDIPSQIKKLSELKDLGIISEEEFNTKKKELLSKM
jgi:hypothetical protein